MMRENVFKAGAVSLVGSSFSAASALLVAIVVGRSLGPSGTGIFFQAVAVFAFLSAVLMLGTNVAVIWALARQRAAGGVGGENRILAMALGPVVVVSVVVALVLHVTARPVAEFLSGGQVDVLEDVLLLLSWFLPLSSVMGVLHTAVRVQRGVMSFSLLQDVAVPASRLVGVALAAALGASAYLTVGYWVASVPLWLLVTIAWLVRPVLSDLRAKRAPGGPAPEPGASTFWRYSGARAVGVAIEFGLDWFDVLVVAALRTPAEAGIYAVASRAIQAGRVVDRAARVAAAPTISLLLARGERQEASTLHLGITRVTVLISWPYYLMLAVMGPAVLSLFGEGFREGAFVVGLLGMVMMVVVSAGMLQSILLMGGKSTWQVYNKSVALALSVVGNLVLVPIMGITGAAVTWAFVAFADTAIAAWLVHWRMGVHLAPHRLLRVGLVPVGVFGLGGWLLRLALGTSILDLLVWLLVLVPTYAGLIWLLRERLEVATTWRMVGVAQATSFREPGEEPSQTPAVSSDPGWVFHESGADGEGFEGWLYHFADGTMSSENGTVYRYTFSDAGMGATPASGRERAPGLGPDHAPQSSNVPAFVEYRPSELRSYILATVLVLATVAAVVATFGATPDGNVAGFFVAVGLAVVAFGAWWGLTGWNPTVVSIRDGTLEVASRGHRRTIDLRDPKTQVQLGDRPGSHRWRAVVRGPDRCTVVIRAQQVKARHFTEIVEYHRSHQRTPEESQAD